MKLLFRGAKGRNLEGQFIMLARQDVGLTHIGMSWLARIICFALVSSIVTVFVGCVLHHAKAEPKHILLSLRMADGGDVGGIVVVPTLRAKYPVVICSPGRDGNAHDFQSELDQLANLGFAVVSIEHAQSNQALFDQQFIALARYLEGQPWAQSNAAAWVDLGGGSPNMLGLLLRHPEIQPQLLVTVSESRRWELDAVYSALRLDSEASAQWKTNPMPIHCPVALVQDGPPSKLPAQAMEAFLGLLRARGISVVRETLACEASEFDDNRPGVLRAAVEYCRAHLPLADYASAFPECGVNPTQREQFNVGMQRAGLNRRELWHAVASTRGVEQHTMMVVIGYLEDYDLAHIQAAHLKEVIHVAWRARRQYSWCREAPLDIFEKFTANPRVFEEPSERFQDFFRQRLRREIKYCHTTEEACNAIWRWMHRRVEWRRPVDLSAEQGAGATPRQVLDQGFSECSGMVILYTALCRSIGLPTRPASTIWQLTSLGHHWTEVWSVEEKQWHANDCSAEDRPYGADWLLRVPKAVIHAPAGIRGTWNGIAEGRFDAFTNTVGLFYPSGQVTVRVLEHGAPVRNRFVLAENLAPDRLVTAARAKTDVGGEAHFTLGASARQPYRFSIDQSGDTDWQWLEVKSNNLVDLVLNLGCKRPFDKKTDLPPALTILGSRPAKEANK